MPFWISQSAINDTSLCWHFQILQTVPNILVYDTSCKKKRFDYLKFLLHRVPLKMTIWEHKMTKKKKKKEKKKEKKKVYFRLFPMEFSVFPKKSSTFIRKPAKI